MIPARTSRRFGGETKLLTLTPNGKIHHAHVRDLKNLLAFGDLLIVNRSATLPSSFRGYLQRTNEFVEIRLAAFQGPNPMNLKKWYAFSFGPGDWREATENRQPPPTLFPGDKIIFGPELHLEILNVKLDRLLEIQFVSSQLEKNLYRYGRPIQYSYLKEDLEVWDQQTIFSGPPISVEPPSASFPLTWEMVLSLKEKGVRIANLLHGAGLSSTGSTELDQKLPLAEWYEIPTQTAEAFYEAKKNHRKIIALGTTVLRAMESAWNGTILQTGAHRTDLKILPQQKLNTVNGLITGMHDVGTSHMNILDSILPIEQIRKAYSECEQLNYRAHEFGDIAYLQGKI